MKYKRTNTAHQHRKKITLPPLNRNETSRIDASQVLELEQYNLGNKLRSTYNPKKHKSRLNGIMGKISKELDQKRTRNSNSIEASNKYIDQPSQSSNKISSKSKSKKSISDSSDSFNPLSIDGEIKRKIIRKKRNNGFSSPYSGHVFVTFFFCLLEICTFIAVFCPYAISDFGIGMGIFVILLISVAYLTIFGLILVTMKKNPTDLLSITTKNR
ncbi:unnamed protein product [Moneuplotes crassus]|uniref:Uncharacterized protein n=1 Tax=Euplotes crassus TaxID=5936 RepID=A0AAD1U830_EUPCR|nr:unnamed protein product [Moneuplotes crassus]